MAQTVIRSSEELLTVEELARALKCKPSAIRAWCAAGCPRVQISRLVRFRLSDMLVWLERRGAKAA